MLVDGSPANSRHFVSIVFPAAGEAIYQNTACHPRGAGREERKQDQPSDLDWYGIVRSCRSSFSGPGSLCFKPPKTADPR